MNRDFNDSFNEFKDLTMSSNSTLSKAPAQIFNRGFTASTGVTNEIRVTVYNDAKALYSVAHPRVDGGTAQSNASSTSISLSDTNLETGRVALLEQLQDDGVPLTGMGELWLVVPTALDKSARIITGSDLRSNTTDNDLNIYTGGAVKVMSSHWLGATNGGSDSQWQLNAPSVSRLQLVLRNGPELDQNVDKNTKSILFDVVLDFSVGSADWRGTYGSKGDGTSYSG